MFCDAVQSVAEVNRQLAEKPKNYVWIRKDLEGRTCGLRYCPEIFLEVLRKIMTNLSKDSGWLGQDTNQTSPEHKSTPNRPDGNL